jgi:hypothetical protein
MFHTFGFIVVAGGFTFADARSSPIPPGTGQIILPGLMTGATGPGVPVGGLFIVGVAGPVMFPGTLPV